MVAKAVQKSPKEIIGVDLKTFIKFSSMLSNKDRYISIMIAEKNIVPVDALNGSVFLYLFP